MSNELPGSTDQTGKWENLLPPADHIPQQGDETGAKSEVAGELLPITDEILTAAPSNDAASSQPGEPEVAAIESVIDEVKLVEEEAEKYSQFEIRPSHVPYVKKGFLFACVMGGIGIIATFCFNETGFMYSLGFACAIFSFLLIVASQIYRGKRSTFIILLSGFIVAIASAAAYFPSGGVQRSTQYILDPSGPYRVTMVPDSCKDNGSQTEPVLTCKVVVRPPPTQPAPAATNDEKALSAPQSIEPTLTPSATAKSQ